MLQDEQGLSGLWARPRRSRCRCPGTWHRHRHPRPRNAQAQSGPDYISRRPPRHGNRPPPSRQRPPSLPAPSGGGSAGRARPAMASCADILRSEFPDLDGELFAYVTGERLPHARWGSASRRAACRDTSPLRRQAAAPQSRQAAGDGWGRGRGSGSGGRHLSRQRCSAGAVCPQGSCTAAGRISSRWTSWRRRWASCCGRCRRTPRTTAPSGRSASASSTPCSCKGTHPRPLAPPRPAHAPHPPHPPRRDEGQAQRCSQVLLDAPIQLSQITDGYGE